MIRTKQGTEVETFHETGGGRAESGDFLRERIGGIPTWRWRGKCRSIRAAARKGAKP